MSLPSDLPPVRYKGSVWIRVGPSRRGANQQEERILIEKRTALGNGPSMSARAAAARSTISSRICSWISYLPAAVDRAVIAENNRGDEEQMASLAVSTTSPQTVPTHAGALLFARDPLRWLAGAWIQFVRWPGTTMAHDPIGERRFSGDLITVLREVEAFVSFPVRARPVPESALRERTAADYPAPAIRELLLNAIMHRSYESNAPVRFSWYDDRIEIQSPGGLYGAASRENFPRQTDYRNPVLSGALATLGYVNAFGRGVIRAQNALRRNGNPAAEFAFDLSHVLATIRRAP